MKEKIMDGQRFLSRGRHKKRELAEKNAERLRKGGRYVRIIFDSKDGMYHVWATSMFG